MLFNSLEFAVFFCIVYGLYLVMDFRWQNHLLLVASYFFYGCWDWRFLALILVSTTVDFVLGRRIYKEVRKDRKKWLIAFSVTVNLVFLGFFKYFNFFASNLTTLLHAFGVAADPILLRIVLPVGISFYTFQSISYTIDIYRGEVKPASRFDDYALFVAFFPQLVAGPIQRAKHLLPQIIHPRVLQADDIREGGYLALWGLFQKVFVADHLAQIVDNAFRSDAPYHGFQVLLAVYAFAFQIYCDFAGYSNMARGIAKMMGFNLTINFNLPYFSENPGDFWSRWHISLSTWLRDYLYIPLGGNRHGTLKTVRNLFLTMLLGGLWHGASWTFVLWGAYHGILLAGHRVMRFLLEQRSFPRVLPQGVARILRIVFFFHLTCFGWLFFRAKNFAQLWQMLQAFCGDFHPMRDKALLTSMGFPILFFAAPLVIMEYLQYLKRNQLIVLQWPAAARWAFCVVVFHVIFIFFLAESKQFIYFQF